jgi:hypothetical protein
VIAGILFCGWVRIGWKNRRSDSYLEHIVPICISGADTVVCPTFAGLTLLGTPWLFFTLGVIALVIINAVGTIWILNSD